MFHGVIFLDFNFNFKFIAFYFTCKYIFIFILNCCDQGCILHITGADII